jgi:hypothetical protein
VLLNGEILEIGGDHLDAAGYDFLGLIIGSEGQLGMRQAPVWPRSSLRASSLM